MKRDTDVEKIIDHKPVVRASFDDMSDRCREATMHNWGLKSVAAFRMMVGSIKRAYNTDDECQVILLELEDKLGELYNRMQDVKNAATDLAHKNPSIKHVEPKVKMRRINVT